MMTTILENKWVQEWLVRIAVTIAIAVVLQWWPNQQTNQQHAVSPPKDQAPDIIHHDNHSPLLDRIEQEEEEEEEEISRDVIEQEEEEEISRDEPTNNLDTHIPATTTSTVQQQQVAIKARHGHHPGLDAFLRWYEVEASLYRIYTLGKTDGTTVSTPFMPKSERGRVSLCLNVTNRIHREISVYWIDYGGNESHRGNVKHGNVFRVTTWIGHPWTFRFRDTQELICHYIPYRIIQNTPQVPTIDDDDPDMGVHRFTIQRASRVDTACLIEDPVFPTNIQNKQDAAAWTFQQMSRMSYPYANTLTKYLTNIAMNPAETKYRQIRTAQHRFSQEVWNTPARGLLLAIGFVEEGAYAEMGCANEPLSRERVQDLSLLLFYLEQWKAMDGKAADPQPAGADGYGRAGFGRTSIGQH